MSSENVVSGNEVDNCCDITTDAVPDQARSNVKSNTKPSVRSDEEKSDINDCGKHRFVNRPAVITKPRPVPRSFQTPGAAHITYNISNAKDVHIGNNISLSFTPKESTAKTSPMKETNEIKKLLQSNEPITLNDINIVSTHVGLNWKQMGRNLNYSTGQLEQFEADHGRTGLREVVYQLLLDWKRVNTSNATVGILCAALKNANQSDAIIEWTKLHV